AARLVDHDTAVCGTDDRFAVIAESPAGDGVERHDAAAHSDGLNFLRSRSGNSEGSPHKATGKQAAHHDGVSWGVGTGGDCSIADAQSEFQYGPQVASVEAKPPNRWEANRRCCSFRPGIQAPERRD